MHPFARLRKDGDVHSILQNLYENDDSEENKACVVLREKLRGRLKEELHLFFEQLQKEVEGLTQANRRDEAMQLKQ